MNRRIFRWWSAAAAVALVTGGNADALDGRALTQPQRALLRMAPEVGQVSVYRSELKMFMDAAALGMSADQPLMTTRTFMTQRVTRRIGEDREIMFVIDSMSMDSPMIPGLDAATEQMMGVTQRMVMSPLGEIKSFEVEGEVPDDVRQGMESAQQSMAGFSLNLPEEPVGVGDTWSASHTMEMAMGPGQTMTMSITGDYLIEEVTVRNGSQLVTLALTGIIDGDGGPMVGRIEGEITGGFVFDATLGRVADQSADMTMNMNAGGQAISMRMAMVMRLLN
jgi:hypothetical protein